MQDICSFFNGVDDPRRSNARRHDLQEMLTIAFPCFLSGGRNCADMERFGRMKEGFLRRFMALEHGIPSHDASYVQRIRNERRWWLWKNLARFPVQNMPVAFRRPSGSFLCRGRRRRVPPGGVGAGLAPQDGLDRYRLGSRQRIRGEAWSARPPFHLPGPGWMPGFSEPDHREDRSGRA